MYNFLLNLFVKRKKDDTDARLRHKYGAFSGIVGIILNVFLASVKFALGIITGSVSIKADAFNNLSDSITSIVSIIAFKMASKPADKKHPFGHARIEYIVSMLLSFFLIFTGVELLKSSIHEIFNNVRTEYPIFVLVVLALTVLVKIWLAFLYKFIVKKTESTVVEANAADSLYDALATGAVLVSAVISKFTTLNLDGYAGAVISIFLIINALKILNDTKNYILGSEPDAKLIKDIKEYALSSEEIVAIHDLFIHNYGPGRCFATFHAEVDGKKDIFTTHDAVDNIEKGVYNKFGVHCTVHLDPIIMDDESITELKNRVVEAVQCVDFEFTIHDFRVVPGDTHSNLIFDVLVPFDCKKKDEEIISLIDEKVKLISPKYFVVITVDRGEKI